MFFTLIILPAIVFFEAGSLNNLSASIDSSLLNPFNIEHLTSSASNSFSMAFIGIISSLAWGLGYFGQPHILTKFMAIEDPEEITVSRKIALPCGLY